MTIGVLLVNHLTLIVMYISMLLHVVSHMVLLPVCLRFCHHVLLSRHFRPITTLIVLLKMSMLMSIVHLLVWLLMLLTHTLTPNPIFAIRYLPRPTNLTHSILSLHTKVLIHLIL